MTWFLILGGKEIFVDLGFSCILCFEGHGVHLAIPWTKMVPEHFASKYEHCPRSAACALLDYHTDRRITGYLPTTIFDLDLRPDGHWQARTFQWDCEVAHIPSEAWNNNQDPLVICAPGLKHRRIRDDNQSHQKSETFEPFGFKLTTQQTTGNRKFAQINWIFNLRTSLILIGGPPKHRQNSLLESTSDRSSFSAFPVDNNFLSEFDPSRTTNIYWGRTPFDSCLICNYLN